MSLFAGIILLSGSLVGAVIYRRTGSEVVISSGSDAARITTITWKHNEDIAVEWYGGEPTAYRHFNGSTFLDIWTGALTISGLTRDHSGFYTAEINDKVIGTTEVQVISPVPKPTVSKQCDAKMTYCTLTCEGNTTDSEPVTYSWGILGAQNYSKGQQINLTKENHEPWYRCEMRNPISSETSEEFLNPFSNSLPSRSRMFILVPVISLLFGFVGICIYVKYISEKGEENKGTDEATTTSESQEASTSAAETSNKSGNSPDQVQTNGEIPRSSALTENSPKKEEKSEVQDHKSETSESNNQTEKSAVESNGHAITIPLLEQNRRNLVSARRKQDL